MVLEWAPPRRLGGRSDTSYSLECLICPTGSWNHNSGKGPKNHSASQPESQHGRPQMQADQGIMGTEVQLGRGVFQSGGLPAEEYPGLSRDSGSQLCLPCGTDVHFSPGQTDLKTTKVVVSELRAHTHYTFTVHTRNGVSEAGGMGASQSASVTVTTNQAGEKRERCVCGDDSSGWSCGNNDAFGDPRVGPLRRNLDPKNSLQTPQQSKALGHRKHCISICVPSQSLPICFLTLFPALRAFYRH